MQRKQSITNPAVENYIYFLALLAPALTAMPKSGTRTHTVSPASTLTRSPPPHSLLPRVTSKRPSGPPRYRASAEGGASVGGVTPVRQPDQRGGERRETDGSDGEEEMGWGME